MHTYQFLYKVPGSSEIKEMQVVSSCFLVAAERFREITESRYRQFDLVQAYSEQGVPLYCGNPQEQFRDKFGVKYAGVRS